MEKQKDMKNIVAEHSRAKIDLYKTYLAIYLNILSRVNHIRQIYIFDLFCGEGQYQDGEYGSPIVALNEVNELFSNNPSECPNILFVFNDKDKSTIEPEKYKIERVEELAQHIQLPSNVHIDYNKEDFSNILPISIEKVKKRPIYSRGLFFIDPYGYKEIDLEEIKKLIQCGNTELIMFLPTSFMYRFAESSYNSDAPGTEPIKKFTQKLFNEKPNFIDIYDFIEQLKCRFESYLNVTNLYITTYSIQRDPHNVYCLFLFTTNIRGFEKMLEAKKRLDPTRGSGYRIISDEFTLFNDIDITQKTKLLEEFLKKNGQVDNNQLYDFALRNELISSEVNCILRDWQSNRVDFEAFSLDEKKLRKGSFFIKLNPERKVGFRFK